jgi:hypothetical protein
MGWAAFLVLSTMFMIFIDRKKDEPIWHSLVFGFIISCFIYPGAVLEFMGVL